MDKYDIDIILDQYYEEATEKLYPDFYSNTSIEDEILPAGYSDLYFINDIYEAQDDVYDMLSDDGYQIVMLLSPYGRIGSKYFLGIVVGDKLIDVTEAIAEKIREYESAPNIEEVSDEYEEDEAEDWSEDVMLANGKALYDAFGSEVDTGDMTEYDAACYLAYKRNIGEV